MDVQTLKEGLIGLEQLGQGIDEQGFAEASRARQEVVLALVDQPFDVGRLVDIIVALFTNLAEGLDADEVIRGGLNRVLTVLPDQRIFWRRGEYFGVGDWIPHPFDCTTQRCNTSAFGVGFGYPCL